MHAVHVPSFGVFLSICLFIRSHTFLFASVSVHWSFVFPVWCFRLLYPARLHENSMWLRRISSKRYTWRTVTAIYTRLTVETWWQQFFRRLSNCDAPSQLISLVLLTASLEQLGFEIRSWQAISIPKRKMLLVSPLRHLAHRAVDRGAFPISRYRDIVIPLPASAQWLAPNLE